MPDAASSPPDPINALHPPRHHNRRAMGVVVLLILVAACLIAYEVAAHSRYKVISKTDRISGYRVEYTVSSNYSESYNPIRAVPEFGESYEFARYPPPQALKWIYAHILHRPTSKASLGFTPLVGMGPISYQGAGMLEIMIDGQGYPYMSFRTMKGVLERHLLVCGCPATWYAINRHSSGASQFRLTRLYVKTKDQPVCYLFEATDDLSDPTNVAAELMKIKDSIRIIKTKQPRDE